MIRILGRFSSSRKQRNRSNSGAPHARFANVEQAKCEFATLLKELLDRPDPAMYTCSCCGHENRLGDAEQVHSTCMFSQLELRRFRCGHCGLIFGPMPLVQCAPHELGALYACLYRFYREGFSQPFQEKTFYLMNPSRRGEYLNYACGDWTEGVERLRSLGWQVWGFEPFQRVNSDAIETSRERMAQKQFDGLMTHNFIEHVQDPTAFFTECSELIAPGGKMAHSSACYDYVFEVSPFHLFFFCGDAVNRLAGRNGFRLESQSRVDQDFPGYQYVCCIFQKLA